MMTGYEGMLDRAREARKKYDESIYIIEEKVIKTTTVNLERLRPQITDKEAFNQLIAVINEATQKNYNIAELQEKIFVLGANVKDTVIEVASIIKK
jgi:replicative DNA helicase